MKKRGKQRAKLGRHSFKWVFTGYPTVMANIRYIATQSGLVETDGHATFNESSYCAKTRPPSSQLLCDILGLVEEKDNVTEDEVHTWTVAK